MTSDDAREGDAGAFSVAQGELLRSARARRHLTLHDVESVTDGEFKAASLSAYERGERAISVLRLLRIADVYQMTIEELLPPTPAGDEPARQPNGSAEFSALAPQGAAMIGMPRLRLDMDHLRERSGPGWDQLKNLADAIQHRRRGRVGRYLVLRGEDVWIVAALFGTTPHEAVALLVRESLAKPG